MRMGKGRMKIDEISRQLENTDKIKYEGECHDCGNPVQVRIFRNDEGAVTIEGGAVYDPIINGTKRLFYKCEDCFKKKRELSDFVPCEVYTRVVGYLRPVLQFNPGKQAEYEMRKNYVMPK